MGPEFIAAIVAAVATGLVSSAATVIAIKVELKFIKRDVNRLTRKVFPEIPHSTTI